jgi:hypothetical protein
MSKIALALVLLAAAFSASARAATTPKPFTAFNRAPAVSWSDSHASKHGTPLPFYFRPAD